MADKTMRTCDIAECGNTLTQRSELPTCTTCRASFSYWKKRRPAQLLERRRKLTKYSDRMDTLMGGKVTIMPSRTRRRMRG